MSYARILSGLQRLSLMERQRVAEEEWVREGQKVTSILCENEGLFLNDGDFGYLMDYISDYDVRLKDPVYGQSQREGVDEIIRALSVRRDS